MITHFCFRLNCYSGHLVCINLCALSQNSESVQSLSFFYMQFVVLVYKYIGAVRCQAKLYTHTAGC